VKDTTELSGYVGWTDRQETVFWLAAEAELRVGVGKPGRAVEAGYVRMKRSLHPGVGVTT